MRKMLTGATILMALFAGAVFAADTPDIETIMKKVNGKNGLHKKVGEGIKSDSPKWDDISKQMKDYSSMAADLGKNACPKGDKASWDKLTKAYSDNAKKLADAVEKKDKSAASAAHGALQKSCKACHDVHK
ncbi:MAG: cytochrome c [Gemmataceae bacterium]|nr:cytochrome c [Gemmataceae bacterium]